MRSRPVAVRHFTVPLLPRKAASAELNLFRCNELTVRAQSAKCRVGGQRAESSSHKKKTDYATRTTNSKAVVNRVGLPNAHRLAVRNWNRDNDWQAKSVFLKTVLRVHRSRYRMH